MAYGRGLANDLPKARARDATARNNHWRFLVAITLRVSVFTELCAFVSFVEIIRKLTRE
jgi:hypothetical protein